MRREKIISKFELGAIAKILAHHKNLNCLMHKAKGRASSDGIGMIDGHLSLPPPNIIKRKMLSVYNFFDCKKCFSFLFIFYFFLSWNVDPIVSKEQKIISFSLEWKPRTQQQMRTNHVFHFFMYNISMYNLMGGEGKGKPPSSLFAWIVFTNLWFGNYVCWKLVSWPSYILYQAWMGIFLLLGTKRFWMS